MAVKIMEKFVFSLISLFFAVGLHAQEKALVFGVGIEKDFFGAPISSENLVVTNTDIKAVCLVRNKWDLSLGIESGTLKEYSEKRFETINSIMMGVGYRIGKHELYHIEPNLSFANSINSFSSFRNCRMDLGVKFHYFNIVFLGTGLRYMHCRNSILVHNFNILTWYWNLGIHFYLTKPNYKIN